MDKPKRIQRKRTKGWKMPPNTIYVGRPSKWGNPASTSSFRDYTPEQVAADYRKWVERDMGKLSWDNVYGKPPTLDEIRAELRGKNLACWCPLGQPCHADVLLELANPVSKGAGG